MNIRKEISKIRFENFKIKKRKDQLRYLEIMLMRSLGYSYQEIATEFDFSYTNAYRIVNYKEKDGNEIREIIDNMKLIIKIIIDELSS